MEYYFECECGNKSRVLPSQAGTSLRCICGRTSRLPSLSKLKKEEPKRREGSATPAQLVTGPAVGLVTVGALSIAILLCLILFNVYLLTSGIAAQLPDPSVSLSKESSIAIRMMVEIVAVFANVGVIAGALQMKNLRNYGLAKTAAVLAIIPCLSPLCFVSIPLGVLALSYLNRSEVRSAFES